MISRRRMLSATGLLLGGCWFVAGCTEVPAKPRSGSSKVAAAQAKGTTEAQASIAADVLSLKEYPPLPSPANHGDYIQLLKDRCEVGYVVLSLPPDVSDEDFRAEVAAWNDVMLAEIRRRFGNDIIQQLHDEANQRWEERIQAAQAKQGT